LLINSSISTVESVYGYYSISDNKIYFYDSSQNKWLGGLSPGSDSIVETPWSKLNFKNTTVTKSGTILSIKWAITFKEPFTGIKNSYLLVKDKAGASNGWNKSGALTLPNDAPQTNSINPSSGAFSANEPVNFTIVYSDSNGWRNIQYAYLLINTSATGVKGLYLYYNQNNNLIYLRNDSNTAWLGGFAPGKANIIENSYCIIDCSKIIVTGESTTLTLNCAVTFKDSFIGNKNIYLYAKDDAGASTGWINKGNLTISNVAKERIYIYANGQRVAMEENGLKFFYHNDHLGGINIVTNEAGEQVKRLEYQPYGDTKLEEGSKKLSRKFTGKELDDSTRLYNFLARQYDPKIGRFVTADPIDYSDAGIKIAGGRDLQTFLANSQNLNRYAYCLNNPIKYTDPDGLYIVLNHGADSKQGAAWAEKLKDELIKNGVKQDIYIYRWGPANLLNFGSKTSEASNSFINYINTLRKKYSGSEPVNIFCHSAGSVLLNKALRQGLKVDNVIIAGSPITMNNYDSFVKNTRETHIFESSKDVVNFWISGWQNNNYGLKQHSYTGVRHNDWVMPWNIKNSDISRSVIQEYSKILNNRDSNNR